MTSTNPVRTQHLDGGVRLLVLDRPPANAIDETLLHGLDAALDEAAGDAAVRAVVVTGAGRFFSGGFDLRAPRREAGDATAMVMAYRDTHRRLLACPKPTIAWINGHAIAGGLVLALACDHRVAVEGDYRVGLNELAIGAAFPAAAMEIIRLRLGHAAATELVLGAQVHSASDLVRLGVVERLVTPATVEEHTITLARRLGSYPKEPYAHAKTALVQDALARLDAVTPEQELAMAALWITDESRAARARQRKKL